jgi:hypothetical protein
MNRDIIAGHLRKYCGCSHAQDTSQTPPLRSRIAHINRSPCSWTPCISPPSPSPAAAFILLEGDVSRTPHVKMLVRHLRDSLVWAGLGQPAARLKMSAAFKPRPQLRSALKLLHNRPRADMRPAVSPTYYRLLYQNRPKFAGRIIRNAPHCFAI